MFLSNVTKLLIILILMNYVTHSREDVLRMGLVVLKIFNVKMSKQKKFVIAKYLVPMLEIAGIYQLNAVFTQNNLFVLILLLVLLLVSVHGR